MLLRAEDICGLLPHTGRMCLIERILSWDEEGIVCLTGSHRLLDHPLREQGALSAIHAVEYGAQAMGIHRGLRARQTDGRPDPKGYIAAIRGLHLHRRDLHDLAGPLTIEARRLGGQGSSFVYAIRVHADTIPVLEARITVMTQTENEP